MTTPQNVIAIAKLFDKYEQHEDHDNPFTRWYYGGKQKGGDAWCGEFVSACFAWAGMSLRNLGDPKGYSYCPTAVDKFKKLGQWNPGDPKPGDIVFYNFTEQCSKPEDDRREAQHTGIVIEVDGHRIRAIDGNTSKIGGESESKGGTVQIKWRSRDCTIGYGKPSFDGKPISKFAVDDSGQDVPLPPTKEISLTNSLVSDPLIPVWRKKMAERGWHVSDLDSPIFDQKLKDILISFQQDMCLEADGVLGPVSWLLTWVEPITKDE